MKLHRRRLSWSVRFVLFAVCPLLLILAEILREQLERIHAMNHQPLLLAIYWNDYATAKKLLDNGADANVEFRDPDWEEVPRNALMIASERGNPRMVRLLLKHGAMQMDDGWRNTPISVARERGNEEVVKILEGRDRRGENPDD